MCRDTYWDCVYSRATRSSPLAISDFRSTALPITAVMAAANASTFSRGTLIPHRGASTTSGNDVPSNTTVGVPHANASIAIIPKVSSRDGIRNTSAAFMAVATSVPWSSCINLSGTTVYRCLKAATSVSSSESKQSTCVMRPSGRCNNACSAYWVPLKMLFGTQRTAATRAPGGIPSFKRQPALSKGRNISGSRPNGITVRGRCERIGLSATRRSIQRDATIRWIDDFFKRRCLKLQFNAVRSVLIDNGNDRSGQVPQPVFQRSQPME